MHRIQRAARDRNLRLVDVSRQVVEQRALFDRGAARDIGEPES